MANSQSVGDIASPYWLTEDHIFGPWPVEYCDMNSKFLWPAIFEISVKEICKIWISRIGFDGDSNFLGHYAMSIGK